MKKWLLSILFFLQVLHIKVFAMPIPDLVHWTSDPMSLTELLDIALKNNPETKTAWWNAQRAAASRNFLISEYYPKLKFRASSIHGRDYKFPNGRLTTYTSLDGDVILSYLLNDFGEREAKLEASKAALIAVNWQSNWTVQKVIFNVIAQAYTYLNAVELLESRLASLRDAQKTLNAAEELYQAGLRSVTDVFAIKATVSDMEIGVALQKAETGIALGKLAVHMGLNVDADINVQRLPDPANDRIQTESLDALIAEANCKRADLLAKRSELMQKYALYDKAKAQYNPKLSFNGTGGYKRYIHDRTNGSHYKLALYFDVPIYDGFESIYQKRVAYYDAQATESDLVRLELDISMEILTYSKMFEAARQILVLAHNNLQNSYQSFEGTLEKYRAGTQSIFDLTAAQKQLADARIKHGEAKTRWYRTLAQLAYATGTITQFMEDPCQDGE